RYLLDRWIGYIAPVLPWVSIVGIGGVVFPTVATNVDLLVQMGLIVFAAVLLHNVLGYILGYLTGKALQMPVSYLRCMAVEIGTQSAGLAAGMPARFCAQEAAPPGVCAAVSHNIAGAFFSAVASRVPAEPRATLETGENIEAA